MRTGTQGPSLWSSLRGTPPRLEESGRRLLYLHVCYTPCVVEQSFPPAPKFSSHETVSRQGRETAEELLWVVKGATSAEILRGHAFELESTRLPTQRAPQDTP